MNNYPSLAELHYAYGPPPGRAQLRATPEDFYVAETLGFEPDGEGEHVLVQVRKRDANTEWVARQLAKACGVAPNAVSYAGLKDRRAVVLQWFSVHLVKRAEPDWDGLADEHWQVLGHARHRRKLRRGALRNNAFRLTLRNLKAMPKELESRLAHIAAHGVPNYFGPQRFGYEEQNLTRAAAWFAGKERVRGHYLRGLYLSAARSFLFNRVLSRRIADATWLTPLPGDVAQLDGSHSVFQTEAGDAKLAQRLAQGDIHLTGPMWGKGERLVTETVAELENACVAPYPELCTGLEHNGLEQERRALRLKVSGLVWAFEAEDILRLEFSLPAGAYASAAVRELVV